MLNFRAPALLSLAALSLAALSLALAAPFAPAFAQAPSPMMHGPASTQSRRMADPLGLTDAQKTRIRPIFMNAGRQMQALQINTTLSPAARMAKMQALQRSTQMQMMAVLTPDQRAKLKSIRQTKREAKEGAPEAN